MKHTAVEWLQKVISVGLTYEQEVLFEGIFEQAKKMEKEQIKNERVEAYHNGYVNGQYDAYIE